MSEAYYNEFNPEAAETLENLIKAGHIAPGQVDTRSIEDVRPDDLRGFTQCHFFAGIGVWSYALRRSGWPDDRPVWTGSCPCQPFSAAGKGEGINDERHLWPAFARLIAACRPDTVMGEQVASSLVSGKRTSADLQRLWERKARLGLLADWLEKDLSKLMQGMPEQSGKIIASIAQGIDRDPRIETCGSSEITGSTEGFAIRSDRGMGSGSTRLWSMRGYGDIVRPAIESGVEHAIAGPDTSEFGLHHGEHQGDPVRPECGMRELGREQSDRNGERDYAAAAEAISRASEETDREINDQDGGSWIDTLHLDLESLGYSFGSVPFPSAGVGAPHIRDRNYWVANTDSQQRPGRQRSIGDQYETRGRNKSAAAVAGLCHANEMVDPKSGRREGKSLRAGGRGSAIGNAEGGDLSGLAHSGHRHDASQGEAPSDREPQADRPADQPGGRGFSPERLGYAFGAASKRDAGSLPGAEAEVDRQGRADGCLAVGLEHAGASLGSGQPGPTNGYWADADWLGCRDGKWRPVEPGSFPLAYGLPTGMGKLSSGALRLAEVAGLDAASLKRAKSHRIIGLRGAGNAINAEAAIAWIETVMECIA